MVDVGANVDCRPRQLLQFAVLGSTYASAIMGIDNPRVALLNNGEEESKGNSVSLEAYSLFKEQADLNFVGNIEGRDLFSSRCDVIVCDGFTGNIVLKTMEGMAAFVASGCVKELGRMPSFFQQIDYTRVGGAPLLGVDGVSIVCHGSSKREAVSNGLKIASHVWPKTWWNCRNWH
jgi:glycerol-3-phosphate acyltransferase PlsX